VPATSAGLPRVLFLLQPLTVLIKQTRQSVHAIRQSILLRCLWLEHYRSSTRVGSSLALSIGLEWKHTGLTTVGH
jgi:hypothetical protein